MLEALNSGEYNIHCASPPLSAGQKDQYVRLRGRNCDSLEASNSTQARSPELLSLSSVHLYLKKSWSLCSNVLSAECSCSMFPVSSDDENLHLISLDRADRDTGEPVRVDVCAPDLCLLQNWPREVEQPLGPPHTPHSRDIVECEA